MWTVPFYFHLYDKLKYCPQYFLPSQSSYVSNSTTTPDVMLDIKMAQSCKIKMAVICCFNKSVPSLFSFWVLFLFFFHQIKQSCFLSLMVKITTFLVWILLRCWFDCLLRYIPSFICISASYTFLLDNFMRGCYRRFEAYQCCHSEPDV